MAREISADVVDAQRKAEGARNALVRYRQEAETQLSEFKSKAREMASAFFGDTATIESIATHAAGGASWGMFETWLLQWVKGDTSSFFWQWRFILVPLAWYMSRDWLRKEQAVMVRDVFGGLVAAAVAQWTRDRNANTSNASNRPAKGFDDLGDLDLGYHGNRRGFGDASDISGVDIDGLEDLGAFPLSFLNAIRRALSSDDDRTQREAVNGLGDALASELGKRRRANKQDRVSQKIEKEFQKFIKKNGYPPSLKRRMDAGDAAIKERDALRREIAQLRQGGGGGGESPAPAPDGGTFDPDSEQAEEILEGVFAGWGG